MATKKRPKSKKRHERPVRRDLIPEPVGTADGKPRSETYAPDSLAAKRIRTLESEVARLQNQVRVERDERDHLEGRLKTQTDRRYELEHRVVAEATRRESDKVELDRKEVKKIARQATLDLLLEFGAWLEEEERGR